MNDRTKKILLIAGAIILAVVIALLLWFFFSRPETVIPPDTNVVTPPPERLPVTSTVDEIIQPIFDEPSVEAALETIAITFTERYGSYSNQENFVNVTELKEYMTLRMQSVVQQAANQLALELAGDQYYGITTRAVSSQVTSYDQDLGRAEVLVSTQRQESRGTTNNPRVIYQQATVRLQDTGSGWRVDDFEWQ